MKSFPLKISTPTGDIFSDDVLGRWVRSTEGDLAVLAGHVPFACALVPCECKVLLSDETERFGHIDSGLLPVGAERAILLSGSFVWNE